MKRRRVFADGPDTLGDGTKERPFQSLSAAAASVPEGPRVVFKLDGGRPPPLRWRATILGPMIERRCCLCARAFFGPWIEHLRTRCA